MSALSIVVKATALLAIAGLVSAFLRRGPAAARHLVWTSALAALLVLPLADAVLPHWTIAVPMATDARTEREAPAPATPLASAAATSVAIGPAAPSPSPNRLPRGPRWMAVAIVVYAAGVLLLMARLGFEAIVLRKLTSSSREVADAGWRRLLDEAIAQLRIVRGVRLLQTADDIVPIAFGTRRPTVLVPASADGWTEDRRRAVLLHELAHVARHDCVTQIAAALACAMYWPHPGVWWAARRLRAERELACDDRVLAAGTEPREYAGHLLELARSLGSAPAPATALTMTRVRELESRLRAVMDCRRNRASLSRLAAIVSLAATIAVLVPVAGIRATGVPIERARNTSARAASVVGFARSIVSAPQDSQDFTGSWEVRLSADGTIAHLNLRTAHGSHGRSMPTSQLEAVAGRRIAGTNGPVHLPFKRDAGTFTIDGICRANVCAGTYLFTPDPAFAEELAKRGIGAPTPVEQFQLAIQDVGFAFLDELSKDGYAKPEIQGLVRAAQHGVGLDYVREMAALGYRPGSDRGLGPSGVSLDRLVALRDHGIDPDYVRGMGANGFAALGVDDLVRARDHGIDPSYVKGMRDAGFGSLDLAGLLNARDHGVDPEYVRGMAALGFKNLALADLLGARDHGIDPEYVRGMARLGYQWPLADLLQARNHGVDPAYVSGLATLGYKGLQLDALIRLRDHGVDPEYVRGLAALGYTGLPLYTLVRLRDHGVDPQYVQRLKDKGMGYLTPDQLIDRRDHGRDDPTVAAREMLGALQFLWRQFLAER